jgi:hypothetical protein
MEAPARILTAGDLCPDLEFEPLAHRYSRQGVEYISNTQVIEVAGLVDTRWFTDFDRDFGSLRHLVIGYDNLGRLDDSTVDPVLWPTLSGWREYRRLTGFRPLYVELRLWSAFGYATTPDAIGLFPESEGLELVEVKGASDLPSYALQTAAQQHAFEERTGEKITRRRTFRISRDGKWKAGEHDGASDFSTFLAALAVAQWKRTHMRGAA